MRRYDLDHIDPKYPKGCDRPYQLVCGFSNELNLIKRTNLVNCAKSNRFLPWRVAKNEVGLTPVNPGDLCQFLDRATGEWVLEEFMGEWWFEQTGDLCGSFVAGKKTSREKKGLHDPRVRAIANSNGGKALSLEQRQKMGRKSIKVQRELGIGIFDRSFEERSKSAKKARETLMSENPDKYEEILRKGGEAVNKQRHMCLKTGHISTPSGLSHFQRYRGIDLSRRVQLTPEECAFIFLWGEGTPEDWLRETGRLNLVRTGLANLAKVTPEQRSMTAKKVNATLWMSLAVGAISTASGIHNIHKKAGLDRETSRAKRAKLTPEEAAFIFLWAP